MVYKRIMLTTCEVAHVRVPVVGAEYIMYDTYGSLRTGRQRKSALGFMDVRARVSGGVYRTPVSQ